MFHFWCINLMFGLIFLLQIQAKTVPANNMTIKTRACLPPHDHYDFCNTKLSISDRVANLISLIKDEEKPPLLTARENGGGSPPPPGNISRIGLPEYDWGVNCVHGAQTSCVDLNGKILCPTSFPNPVNYGATFNSSMFLELGRVVSTELRALWLLGATEESEWSGRPHAGLDCWSPNINIARDPRWGRNQETASEDPYLNGQFGTLYTKGLQEGEDPRFLKVIVTLKHWDAYSLEDADGFTRHTFNAIVSNYTLADTYWPAFKVSVQQGHATGVMCSYNSLNGVPTCANSMLSKVLREKWGFDGYVTSDTGAVNDIFKGHKYVKTGEEASCKALVDGTMDVNSGKIFHNSLLSGVSKGYCKMSDVDRALKNTLKLRFRLGLFDPIEDQQYWHVPPSVINTKETQQLNLLMSLESMVLLKNTNNTLPLKMGQHVAVIGPHAKAKTALTGNYLGQICPDDGFSCIKSPLEAITSLNKGGKVTTAQGCSLTKNDSSWGTAIAAAKASDSVVLIMGIGESIEGESRDRKSIDLPSIQHELISAILRVASDKPVVLVLLNGGMVALDKEQNSVPAILEAGYPGFMGGDAIGLTLFGENDHLGGKLPYTVYPANYIDKVKMSDMEMTAGPNSPGRTYRYYTGPTVYPFGYGLSLTSFKLNTTKTFKYIENSELNQQIKEMKIKVTNIGNRTGDEVVLAYFVPVGNPAGLLKQLFGFQRVHLQPGQHTIVTFNVTIETLSVISMNGDRISRPGKYKIILTNGVDETINYTITVRGKKRILDAFPQHW